MKIAVTADNHIRSRSQNPERLNALADICRQCAGLDVQHIILAGDVLDRNSAAITDVEKVLSSHAELTFHWLCGNHDAQVSAEMITAQNVHLYTEPAIVELDKGNSPFLLVPYARNNSMGELLQEHTVKLQPGNWHLVSHGDWTGSLSAGNPDEPGIYMPLTRTDIVTFQPAQVFLGHIHKADTHGIVHYAGSPCGLDISETGRRTFLLFDTLDQSVLRIPVDTDILLFDETFLIIPHDDEESLFLESLWQRIDSWQLAEEERTKVRLRIRVKGYSSNREKLASVAREALQGYRWYGEEGPDFNMLLPATDPELGWLAHQTAASVRALDWKSDPDLPSKDEILLAALSVIYGE